MRYEERDLPANQASLAPRTIIDGVFSLFLLFFLLFFLYFSPLPSLSMGIAFL